MAAMLLYVNAASPYARMVRMFILERGLAQRVEVVMAKTRVADSPYYRVNPSGRVPYLVLDDGTAFEESRLILDWLDRLDGAPQLAWPDGAAHWEARRLDARAWSFVDGLSVWGRELARAPEHRSPIILAHEHERAKRMGDWWEAHIDLLWLGAAAGVSAPLNATQLLLGCGLGFTRFIPAFEWRATRPRLAGWFERFASRPSFVATAVERDLSK